jgi:isopentenyldiphosphate isomerase
MEEQIELYDSFRNKLNRSIKRGQTVPNDCYRLIVHVCIFNSQNQMLIQQRQSMRRKWPDLWDVSVGGGVANGENSEQAATRELSEELGIYHNFSNERPYITIYSSDSFDDFYILHQEINLEHLVLQKQEVKNAVWANKEQIKNLIAQKQFIDYREEFIDFLFSLKTRGVHKNL